MRALITGITGFAGSHLAEFLLAEHPEVAVFGTYRWRSRMDNVEHLRSRIKLLEADLRDYTSVYNSLDRSKPSHEQRPGRHQIDHERRHPHQQPRQLLVGQGRGAPGHRALDIHRVDGRRCER